MKAIAVCICDGFLDIRTVTENVLLLGQKQGYALFLSSKCNYTCLQPKHPVDQAGF